jgi:hypothetical protein
MECFLHSFGELVRCLCSAPAERARWSPLRGRFLSESKDSEGIPIMKGFSHFLV